MRLNKHVREQILKNAIAKSAFPEKRKKLEQDKSAFAEKVRITQLGGAAAAKRAEATVAEIKKLLLKLPEGCMHVGSGESSQVSVKYGEKWGESEGIKFQSASGTTESRLTISGRFVLSEYPKLQKQWAALKKRKDTLEEQEEELKQNVNAYLYSVTTTKRLVEVWPECAELIPASVEVPSNLPAIPTETLNRVLGLPSVKAA